MTDEKYRETALMLVCVAIIAATLAWCMARIIDKDVERECGRYTVGDKSAPEYCFEYWRDHD